jgi:hypothetical protein
MKVGPVADDPSWHNGADVMFIGRVLECEPDTPPVVAVPESIRAENERFRKATGEVEDDFGLPPFRPHVRLRVERKFFGKLRGRSDWLAYQEGQKFVVGHRYLITGRAWPFGGYITNRVLGTPGREADEVIGAYEERVAALRHAERHRLP